MIAYFYLRNEHEEETGRVEFTGGEFIGDLVEMLFDSIEEIQLTEEDAEYYGVIYTEDDNGTGTYIRVEFDGLETIEEQIDRFTEEAIEYIGDLEEEEETQEENYEYENICKMMREGA